MSDAQRPGSRDDILEGHDLASGLPHLHFSFFIHSFIPRRFLETQSVTKTSTVVGSYAESLRLPALVYMKQDGTFGKKHLVKEPSVTFLHVKDVAVGFPNGINADDCNYVISTDNVHAGFCRLKVLQNGNNDSHTDLHTNKGGITYLASSASRKRFNSKLSSNKKAIESMLGTLLNKGEGGGFDMKFSDIFTGVPDDSLDLRRPFTSIGLRGILVSARQEKLKNHQETQPIGLINDVEPSEVYHELAFTCKQWPSAADEYKSRKRLFGWPTNGTIDKVVACGCHVVPSSHSKSSNSDIEWKLSFDAAEKQLVIQEISDSQRQCFLVFYLLCLHIISEGLISPWHIRSIFFYACENTDTTAWNRNPARCVFTLLDQLIEAIKHKFLPEYFVKMNNLLDHLTDVQASQLERRLTTIRRRPVEELLSLADNYTILDVFPYNMDVKKVFTAVLANAKTYKNPSQAPESTGIFIGVANTLCNGFYHEYGFDHCASIFDDVIDNFVEPICGSEEAEKQREYIPHLLNQRNIEFSNDLPPEEIWKPITFCRFLITRYVEGNEGAGLYEHLACLYHAAANIFRAHKKDLLANAREMFEQALKREGEGHGAGLFVDYGHYLCACGDYKDASTYLTQAIVMEKENPTSVNYYGQMECHTVDDNLKKEIAARGGLEILSVIFAYYLLIECHIKSKKTQNIAPNISEMEHLCDLVKDPIAYELLGYTLLKVKEPDRAVGAFKCAIDIDPKYKVAKENLSKLKKKK